MGRLCDRLMALLIRAGAPMGAMALLTVRGRKTGRVRRTPIAVLPYEGGWRLLATFGIGDWVRNLRAAGTTTLTLRGASVPVTAREMPPAKAAPIIRTTLADAGPTTRRIVAPHFDASPNDAIELWEKQAVHHPLFHLTPQGV